MLPRIERVLSEWLASGARGIGQVLIVKTDSGFVLCHREDEAGVELEIFRLPNDAIEIARLDDAGQYRALKTAPNLRHGWRLEVAGLRGASFGARRILSGPANRPRGLGSASA